MTKVKVFHAKVFEVGEEVRVQEGPNLRPWMGTVTAAKLSKLSGWWYEVEDPDGLRWAMPAANVWEGGERHEGDGSGTT